MSRGPGTVERAVAAAFTASPSSYFTTEDLVALAYPGINRVEKKHRVAVLRAADRVARRMWWCGWRGNGCIVYLNRCDVRSYALGRLRAGTYGGRIAPCGLAARPDPGGRDHKDTLPGGAWHTHVAIACLERDGRLEEAKAMSDAWNASVRRRLSI